MPREGNQSNIQIHVPGKSGKVGPNVQLTFELISEWIRLQGFDEYTTEGLIEMASRYPTNALPKFRKNFNLMLARVRQKRRQEQQGIQEENNEAEES